MAISARIAAPVFVVVMTMHSVAVAAPPQRNSSPQFVSEFAEETALENAPPDMPQIPHAPQLGDEILQDTLPEHESVVEPAPPVYSDQRVPTTQEEFYNNSPSQDSWNVAPYHQPWQRLQHHPLRTHLENRPRQMQLQSDSWLNRPYGVSYYLGGMFLDDPLPGVVGGDVGFTYGGRFNWDFAPRFGVESRLAGGTVGVRDLVTGLDLAPAALFQWDINWLWYWTGDTRWRPYALVGGGLLNLDYYSATTRRYHNNFFELPFGVGLKFRHSTRLALRLELIDNYAFSSGVQAGMHNVSLTAGMEWRFGGGGQRNYWPWNPARNWW